LIRQVASYSHKDTETLGDYARHRRGFIYQLDIDWRRPLFCWYWLIRERLI